MEKRSNLTDVLYSCTDNFLEALGLVDNREKYEKYRTVLINNIRKNQYSKIEPLSYSSNLIKTSKYNLINFLPKNLFEQFRRIANFFFLMNIIISILLPDPPTSPLTSAVPLFLVVFVTGIKQAYEDVLRYKSDLEINNKPVQIFRNGKFSQNKWKDIKCGDVIKVICDEALPCDLLLLNSKSEDRKCYITTANLDGETNFKSRVVPSLIPDFVNENDLGAFQGIIEYEKPNKDLYEFSGKLILGENEFPLSNDNILLRGSCLRVVPFVYGCAIYTGKDTKVMLNTKFQSNKFSSTETKLNIFTFFYIGLLFLLAFICFFNYLAYVKIYEMPGGYLDGLVPNIYEENQHLYNLIVLAFYSQLFNYIVPVSLYVTLEIQRFVGSQFIEWDLEMYDKKTNQPAKVNSSDLNEDLGQIEYLFSDKTGTLTENEMIFKQFSINGSIYEEIEGKLYKLNTNTPIDFMKDKNVLNVLEILSVCHTVEYDESSKDKYQAPSPDELCFIKFCFKLGIVYEGDHKDLFNRNKQIRCVKYLKEKKQYELLDILEFDSTRKRMSVILKEIETNKIIVYCKGAESFVIKNCIDNSNGNSNFEQCYSDINRFAENGWRTLALSMKQISEEEYKQIKIKLNSAYNDILDRKNKISQIFDEIESNLTLIGATAIEDKLQDDVADTLETIRMAGIKVWVLTGDKKETAINISHSCKHFSNNMNNKFILTDETDSVIIKNELIKFNNIINNESNNNNNNNAFIIDGSTLAILMKSIDSVNMFTDICMKCTAVLCCRMSPAQKAEVVRLVKQSKSKPITAAIGDGANDVSMIQEAHVGLGIFGKEGRNAARSADFSFAKFKFLKRILLVHGYLYYTRSANMIQYFLYKNLPFAICQFYYAFFNAFSVASLYDTFILFSYSIFLTSVPPIFFGLFEQKTSIDKIELNPYLYRSIRKNKLLSFGQFLKWELIAIWHSVLIFLFAFGLFSSGSSFFWDGKQCGSWEFGALIITMIFLVVHLKLFIEWQFINIFFLIGYFISLLGYIVICLGVNSFILPKFIADNTENQSLFWIYYTLLSSLSVWLCIIGCLVAAVIPDVFFKIVQNLKNHNNAKSIINYDDLTK